MNCTEIREKLVEYIEGLLPDEQKRQVMLHLDGCAWCRLVLEQQVKLRDRLISDGQTKQSDDFENEVLNRIIREQNKRLKQADGINRQLYIWRTIMKSKITKLAVAAVIVIAVITGIHRSGNFFENSAYAQVVEELRNARTVVFTLITQINQGNGEILKTDVAYKEPDLLRSSTVDGYVSIFNRTSGKIMTIIPTGRFYNLNEIKGLAIKSPFEYIESMKNLPAKADEELGTKEIDGVVVEGYRVIQDDAVKDIWIEPQTENLVQVELKFANAPGMGEIIKNIEFDVELDDSLFSMTPPEGYRLAGEMKIDASAATEEAFIEFLRVWSGGTVDETFPPLTIAVGGPAAAKVFMDMERGGKFKEDWSKNAWQRMASGMVFVMQLPQSSNWRYVGENIKFGTSDKAIFWYRPEGSQNYRVIYGDLSVWEVSPENLPK